MIHIYHKRSMNFDKRSNRRQKIMRRSQDRGKAVVKEVVTILTPSRGASTETSRRHPASRSPSTVTPRHAASRGPSVETPPPSPAVTRYLYRNTPPSSGIARSHYSNTTSDVLGADVRAANVLDMEGADVREGQTSGGQKSYIWRLSLIHI